jgi:hypothetical protein
MKSEEQMQALATAMNEVSDIEPSIPGEALSGNGNFFNQSGGGQIFNIFGEENQYNLGSGSQFQRENLYFGETFKQK